jgi:hypothetical protein
MRIACCVAAAVGVLVLAGCARAPETTASATASATPTVTSTLATLKTSSGKTDLRLRHIPAATGNELAKIASGSVIIVDCRVEGASVTGSQGMTSVWDHLTYQGKSGYVSAAYVEDGAAKSIPLCPYTAAIETTPRPMPTATATDAASQAVAVATSQLGIAEKPVNCSPYSKKCEEWCAHFAAWVWQKAGVPAPDTGFTGDLYKWGDKQGRAHSGVTGVGPGDLVFYGTGPTTTKTSTHVDVVAAAYPDHLHVIGGNVDDRVTERDVPLSGIYGWLSVK